MKSLFLGLAAAIMLALAPGSVARAADAKPTPQKSGRLAVNGVDYYYEIHGRGEPVLLLHGGLGSTELFVPALPRLAQARQVIAVDLQGHGRSSLGSRPIDLIAIGNDLSQLLTKLGYQQVDVFGYSFGGGAGLRLAVQHPQQVRRLAIMSAPFAQNGFFPEMLPQQAAVGAGMADAMKETPIYQSYAAIAPDPGQFPKLLDAMGAFMRKPYNWAEDVKTLKMPVMLIYGDSDMIRPDHIVEFYRLLGGGLRDAGWDRKTMARNRLAILPNATHYDISMNPAVADTVQPFLNGYAKSGTAKKLVATSGRRTEQWQARLHPACGSTGRPKRRRISTLRCSRTAG